MCTYKNQDVFASAFINDIACIAVLVFRNSRLTDKKHYIIDAFTDKNDLYSQFLQQYYLDNTDIPPRILLDTDIDSRDLLEHWLGEKAGKRVEYFYPNAASKKILLICVSKCR